MANSAVSRTLLRAAKAGRTDEMTALLAGEGGNLDVLLLAAARAGHEQASRWLWQQGADWMADARAMDAALKKMPHLAQEVVRDVAAKWTQDQCFQTLVQALAWGRWQCAEELLSLLSGDLQEKWRVAIQSMAARRRDQAIGWLLDRVDLSMETWVGVLDHLLWQKTSRRCLALMLDEGVRPKPGVVPAIQVVEFCEAAVCNHPWCFPVFFQELLGRGHDRLHSWSGVVETLAKHALNQGRAEALRILLEEPRSRDAIDLKSLVLTLSQRTDESGGPTLYNAENATHLPARRLQIARLLFKHGDLVAATSDGGNNALHLMACHAHPDWMRPALLRIARWYAAKGVSWDTPNQAGHTAMDLARQNPAWSSWVAQQARETLQDALPPAGAGGRKRM